MGISVGAVAVGIPSSRLGSRVGPGIPESISTSKFQFDPRASIRHVGCIALHVVFCELICTRANHVSSPPGVRRTMHLVPTSNH